MSNPEGTPLWLREEPATDETEGTISTKLPKRKRKLKTFIVKTPDGIFSVQSHAWRTVKNNKQINFVMECKDGTITSAKCVVASFKKHEYVYDTKGVKILTNATVIEPVENNASMNTISDLEV